jgi:hypothetical protein
MRSALDPFRRETLEHRLDVRLAARRAERARNQERGDKSWQTQRAKLRRGLSSEASTA